MANYNLYNALDLNEDWSCDELRDTSTARSAASSGRG